MSKNIKFRLKLKEKMLQQNTRFCYKGQTNVFFSVQY